MILYCRKRQLGSQNPQLFSTYIRIGGYVMQRMTSNWTDSLAFRLFALANLLFMHASIASAAPNITRLTPLAVAPGQVVELTCHGTELADITNVWTNFPARTELLPPAEGVDANTQVSIRLTVPNDSPTRLAGIRLANHKGVSPLRLMLIDDLRTDRDQGNNHQITEPQPVSTPVAIDGQCEPLQKDCYVITGVAGIGLSVDVLAQRIGSQLDSVIRLLSQDGKELAHNDDSPGCGADSRLRYEFAADGQYILEIRDVRHQGGEQHYYRLRLGDFPLATVAYPMGGRRGEITSFQIAGPAVDRVPTQHWLMSDVLHQPLPIALRYTDGQGSGFVAIRSGDQPEYLEADDNNTIDTANAVTIPVCLNGKFETTADKDYFRFSGQKGERWMIRAHTRSLGSPTDIYMELLKVDGSRLASVDDVGKDEGFLDYTFPENADYILRLEDLHRSGSPQHAYRVEIRPFQDWFDLSVDKETHTVPHAGTIAVKVTAQRRGYGDAIELGVEGAGDDVQLAGHTIPKDKNETQLLITFPKQTEPGDLHFIKVVGRATINEKPFTAAAETLSALRTAIPQTPHLPSSLTTGLAVGVGPEFPAFFSIALADSNAFFPVGTGTSKFKVLVNRLQEKFTTALNIAIHDLPEGYEAKVEAIEEGKKEYLVTLTGPSEPGELGTKIPFRITGNGTFENQTKEVMLGDVNMEIVRPLVVRISPQGNIAPGGQQKLLVKIFRFEEENHPVVVRWKAGPPWLLTPIEVNIPADQDQVEVMLAAAAETDTGTEGNLIALATSTVDGQPLTVESTSVSVRVETPPAETPPAE